MGHSSDLQGMTVMVTRPAHQSQPLCRMIESLGGHVISFPALEIADVNDDNNKLGDLIGRLHEYDLAIFISANAVTKGLAAVRPHRQWPAGTRVAAVGARTARVLEEAGLAVDVSPREGFDSEHLLALDELQQMDGKKVIIFRGQGGRELLAETLRQRGAAVDYAEVYRRVAPRASLREALQAHPYPDTIVVTSGEGMVNLLDMAQGEDRQRLLETPLTVISQRIAQKARALGFTRPAIVARRADDDAIVAALGQWWNDQGEAEQKLQ